MTKVKKITVSNVKAITDQTLNLNGATAILCGGNNRGKSTLLKCLKDRLLKITDANVIRRGETEGLYSMSFMDGSTIEWELTTKTKAGEKLTLISNDGSKTSVITEIINWFQPSGFDIDKFLAMQPAQQRKTLEKLLGLDLTEIDARYLKATEERKDANRDVERVELNYKGKVVDPDLRTDVIPTEELQKELLGVESHNRNYNIWVTREEELIKERTRLEEELAEVKRKLSQLDDALSKPENQPKTEEQVGSLQTKLKGIQDSNIQIEQNNLLKKSLSELTGLRETAHAKDIAVKDILLEKDKLIQDAQMPEGFAFSEEGLTYNGFELDRAAQSSSALYIAALKLAGINVGNVRFLHFDASMLDNKSLEEVRAWAEENDLQLGIELVTRTGDEEIRYELMEENHE